MIPSQVDQRSDMRAVQRLSANPQDVRDDGSTLKDVHTRNEFGPLWETTTPPERDTF